MSDTPRLDPPTLQFAIARVRRIADEMNADACGALEAGQRAHHDALDFYVDELRITLNSMIDLADSAEPAPPTLSSWVAACEGTALGEPKFVGLWHIGGDTVVSMERSGEGMALRVDWLDARNEEDGCAYSVTHCSTPAELRAVLEALAAKA